jgi:hypothetical protein
MTDPQKAAALSGLDLVPDAAYWSASSLVELQRYDEAKGVLDQLIAMPGLKNMSRVQRLRALCIFQTTEAK